MHAPQPILQCGVLTSRTCCTGSGWGLGTRATGQGPGYARKGETSKHTWHSITVPITEACYSYRQIRPHGRPQKPPRGLLWRAALSPAAGRLRAHRNVYVRSTRSFRLSASSLKVQARPTPRSTAGACPRATADPARPYSKWARRPWRVVPVVGGGGGGGGAGAAEAARLKGETRRTPPLEASPAGLSEASRPSWV